MVILIRPEQVGHCCLNGPPRLAERLEPPAEFDVAERKSKRLRHARVPQCLRQRGGVGERDGRLVAWGRAKRAQRKNPAVFPAVPKLKPPLFSRKGRKGAV